MLNFSNVEEPLFMFHKYSDYLFPIFVIGGILSYATCIYNIYVIASLWQRTYSPHKILILGLCLANGLAALSTCGQQPLLKLQISSDGYFSEIYFLFFKLERVCSVFVYVSEVSNTLYFVSLLLTAALGIQTVISYEFPEENRWNLRQKIKTTIVCSLCFVVPFSLNFHKFSSLRVKADYFNFYSVKCISCRARYNSPIIATKYIILYYHILVDIILPTGLYFVILCSGLIIIHRLLKTQSGTTSTWIRTVDGRFNTMVALVLIICTICNIPAMAMRMLHFLGHENVFPSNIYPDKIISIFVDFRSDIPYVFQTSISGKQYLDDFVKFIFVSFLTEVTQCFMQMVSYMSTSVCFSLYPNGNDLSINKLHKA